MREILFRGKPINKSDGANSWIEGFYTKSPSGRTRILTTYNAKPIEVIPETIGQFTGLTDKIGKKIFEGDIIKWTKRKYTDCSREEIESEEVYIGVLKWSETMYGVYTNKGQGYLLMPYYIESDEFKVIGNIFEHPHLLKEGVTI